MANPFEAEIQQSAQALGLLYQKIPIAHKLCKNGARSFMLPLQENPYDSFFVVRGIHHAVELKSTKEWEPFPFSRIEPHQHHGLAQVEAAGGQGWIFLNMRQRTVKGKRKLDNQAWGILYAHWRLVEADIRGRGRVSLPLEELVDPIFMPLPRIQRPGGTGKLWDLDALFC